MNFWRALTVVIGKSFCKRKIINSVSILLSNHMSQSTVSLERSHPCQIPNPIHLFQHHFHHDNENLPPFCQEISALLLQTSQQCTRRNQAPDNPPCSARQKPFLHSRRSGSLTKPSLRSAVLRLGRPSRRLRNRG